MPIETTFTKARAQFADFCDEAILNRETVIIHRRGSDDIALIAADELNSILETFHLFRSPKNAERLLAAYDRALQRTESPKTIEELKSEMGL